MTLDLLLLLVFYAQCNNGERETTWRSVWIYNANFAIYYNIVIYYYYYYYYYHASLARRAKRLIGVKNTWSMEDWWTKKKKTGENVSVVPENSSKYYRVLFVINISTFLTGNVLRANRNFTCRRVFVATGIGGSRINFLWREGKSFETILNTNLKKKKKTLVLVY